jgi:hypothetical protein
MSHIRSLFCSIGKPLGLAGFLVATMALASVVEFSEARAESVSNLIICTNCGSDPFAADGTVTMSNDGLAEGFFEVTFDFIAEAGKLLDVYFEADEWNAPISFVSVVDSDGLTGYKTGGTPADPPAGDNIDASLGGAWSGTAMAFTGDPSSSPPTITGSSGGYDESLTFLFSGVPSAEFLAFATAVLLDFDEGFRIAMHIGNCTESGGSCTAIGAPIPAALWLFASALLGWVGIGYRRKKPTSAAAA